MCRNRLKNVLNYGKLICTSFVVVLLLMCTTIICNAEETEEYSSVPYINVRLGFGNAGDTYYNGDLVYKDQKVNLNFKENPSNPAVIDITTTKGPYNFLGQYSFLSLNAPNSFESVLGDMLVDDMSEYYSINSKKTEIRILPKSAKEWNAIEKKLGITEENYTSKTIYVTASPKDFNLNIETSNKVEDNPKILTTERYGEDLKYLSNKYTPALRYMKGYIKYQPSVINEGKNHSSFYSEPKINIYFWNAFKTDSSIRKLGLDAPVNILDYIDKNVFYAPAYEVDALYTLAEDDSSLVPAEIDTSWLGDKTVYPHWKRKEGYSSIQIYSEQNIKDSEKPISAVNKEKLDEITELVSGLVESNSVDIDSINTISDWFNISSGRIYDWDTRTTLYNCILKVKAEVEKEVPDNDIINEKMDSILEALEDMQTAQENEYDHSNRTYPQGGGTFYETEFLSSEGVTEGNEIPRLNLTPNRRYKFKGWKVYEWSDKECKFVDSVKYPDIVKPEDFEESSEDDSEEEKEKFLQTGYDTDYYLVAQWEKARSIHFDIEGKIIGEPAESGGEIITPDYETMYVLKNDYLDIESPSRENYDFAGWYVKTGETDKEGVFIEPNENDEYSMQEIIEKADYPGYSTDTYYYLMASWKRIYDNGEDNQEGSQGGKGDSGEGGNGSSGENQEDEDLKKVADKGLKVTFVNNGIGGSTVTISVKKGKLWKDYAPDSSRFDWDYLKFDGWYNQETNEKIDLNSKINIDKDIVLVSNYIIVANHVCKVTLPEFNSQIDMIAGHLVSEYNLPTNNGNEKIVGWTIYDPPYRSVLDITVLPNMRFNYTAEKLSLHPVYESDINTVLPTTDETLSMIPQYRNGEAVTPEICIGGSLKTYKLTKYNQSIEENADLLFQKVYDVCAKTSKKHVIICPKDVSPSESSLTDCEFINSGLEIEDYLNVLTFMHYKYFKELSLFYKNSTEAFSEKELVNEDNRWCDVQVSDFSREDSYEELYPEYKNYIYYDINPNTFVSYYSRCFIAKTKIDIVISKLELDEYTTIDEAIGRVNDYLVTSTAYDDMKEIYDLYWFLMPTSQDRNKENIADFHGVCQSYTKFAQEIFDKCGYTMEIECTENDEGKVTHVVNSFTLNNQKYYNDFTWNSQNRLAPTKYSYMTDRDMCCSGHYNPHLWFKGRIGDVLTKDDVVKNTKQELPTIRIVKIKQNKNKVKITLSKQKNVNEYELIYSTSKNFKNAKTVKSKTNKFTIKNLKAKKKYYFKVRWSQKKVIKLPGKDYSYVKYSKYSKVVSKKIKKYKKKKVRVRLLL